MFREEETEEELRVLLDTDGLYKVEMLLIRHCGTNEPNEFDKFILNIIKQNNGTEDIECKGQILKSIGPVGMNIILKQISDENKANKTLIVQHIPNICSNFVFKRFTKTMKFLDSRCHFIPGWAEYRYSDFNRIVHLIITKNFFYSKFSTKLILLAAKKPVSCFEILTKTVPA